MKLFFSYVKLHDDPRGKDNDALRKVGISALLSSIVGHLNSTHAALVFRTYRLSFKDDFALPYQKLVFAFMLSALMFVEKISVCNFKKNWVYYKIITDLAGQIDD